MGKGEKLAREKVTERKEKQEWEKTDTGKKGERKKEKGRKGIKEEGKCGKGKSEIG